MFAGHLSISPAAPRCMHAPQAPSRPASLEGLDVGVEHRADALARNDLGDIGGVHSTAARGSTGVAVLSSCARGEQGDVWDCWRGPRRCTVGSGRTAHKLELRSRHPCSCVSSSADQLSQSQKRMVLPANPPTGQLRPPADDHAAASGGGNTCRGQLSGHAAGAPLRALGAGVHLGGTGRNRRRSGGVSALAVVPLM